MEKTYYRFFCIELLERLARFEGILEQELSVALDSSLRGQLPVAKTTAKPPLVQALLARLQKCQQSLLKDKELLIGLLSDSSQGAAGKGNTAQLATVFADTYRTLTELSSIALRVENRDVLPETYLFLKDALPEALTCKAGHYAVIVEAEGYNPQTLAEQALQLDEVLMANLSTLQRHNPLGWLGLAQPLAAHFSKSEASFSTIKTRLSALLKPETRASASSAEELLSHCLSLRLLGPAYYFQSAGEAMLRNDAFYLQWVEPALFYGLQHFNFAHNQLVILHEAIDRTGLEHASQDKKSKGQEFSAFQAMLSDIFRAVEKVIPEWQAFGQKNFERSLTLKDRLMDSILLSSAAVFPVGDVAKKLDDSGLLGDSVASGAMNALNHKHSAYSNEAETNPKSQAAQSDHQEFSIYDALSMMTEYPHTPREIVNAGWLHKVERSPVWLFAALQDTQPFAKLHTLVSTQDHLLNKSIETSEVHRVLLCTP